MWRSSWRICGVSCARLPLIVASWLTSTRPKKREPVAILPIRTFGDPALRQKAEPVERITDLHRKLIADMFDTMREAPGVGLAGPQVGVLERVFVWETEDRHGAIINPVITERSQENVEEEEGCLSLPGIYYPVSRASQVMVDGLDENGDRVVLEG